MAITVTTTSAAVLKGATQLTLATTSGLVANSTAVVIDEEMFIVNLVVSSTVVNVTPGQSSTKPTAHGSGRAAYLGNILDFLQSGRFYQPGSANARAFAGPALPTINSATVNTATAVTLTPGQILGGLLLEDPNGGAATATLPAAALMVAAVPGAAIGTSFYFDVKNTADANEVLTIAAGTGGTLTGTATIAQNAGKRFLFQFTAVLPGAETYTCFSLGSYVF